MRIVFIGSGNIAQFFGGRLHKKGHDIVQVYSRDLGHAQVLATATNASVTDNLSEIVTDADVYILAIKDGALKEIADRLHFPDKVVIHCAGAVGLEVLQPTSAHNAVIWSLYSVSKNSLPKSNSVPLVVESSSERAMEAALSLANDISDKVLQTDFRQRQMLHLNAVFANNFTNHLLAIAQKICEEHQLPFEILHPIIRQTLEQTANILPAESQTGPAIRNDQETLEKHMRLLEPHPEWQKIYADISYSIQQAQTVQP